MTDCEWLSEFTAFVQLISAVNFTYMFTHFVEKVYTKIFSDEEVINKDFSSFREGQLAKVKSSIESMDSIEVNGCNTDEHIACLRIELESQIARWDKAKNKTQQIINNLKDVKGIKSLFLYISIFCVLDMFNMAVINVVEWHPMHIFVLATNILAFLYTMYITFKILCSSWKEKEDIYCFSQTRKYMTKTILCAAALSAANEIYINNFGYTDIPNTIIDMILALCVFLPTYPCLLSILFIFVKIIHVKTYRQYTKITILIGIRSLNKRKKKLENAVSTIMDGVNWGTKE